MSRFVGVTSGGIVRALGYVPGSSGGIAGAFAVPNGSSGIVSSGGSIQILSAGSLIVSSGATLTVSSGAVISSGTAQVLADAQGLAGINPLTPGGFVTGRYYGTPLATPTSTALAATSGTLYASLFYVPEAMSFASLVTYIATSSTANLLWGVYGPVTPTHLAAALSGAPKVGQTTSVAISGSNVGHSGAFTSALLPGWHAGVVMGDATFSGGTHVSASVGLAQYLFGLASPNSVSTPIVGFINSSNVFGNGMPSTLPTMTGVVTTGVVAVSWLK